MAALDGSESRISHLQTFDIQEGVSTEELYSSLVDMESKSADPSEEIQVGFLHPGSAEFSHLKEAGIDSAALNNGKIRRQELVDAGYAFVNRIGAGEKPIINAAIPADREGQNPYVSYGAKALLTRDELDQLVSFQEEGAAASAEKTELDATRQDMISFLKECQEACSGLRERQIQLFQQAAEKIMTDPGYSGEDRQSLIDFFNQEDTQQNSGFLLEACLAGINVLKVRGVPIDMVQTRFAKLRGSPSPFLDSGFHFGNNYDVTLFPNDPSKTKRLNMVVVHLLSRGINEMGASNNNSHDQDYMTIDLYREMLLGRAADQDQSFSEDDINLVTKRLLPRARAGSIDG